MEYSTLRGLSNDYKKVSKKTYIEGDICKRTCASFFANTCISNFILFVIFFCDGKDERFEDVDGFDDVVGNVDVEFDCDDETDGSTF